MASVTPMSFFTPDATINPDEYTFEIADAKARSDISSILGDFAKVEVTNAASKRYNVGDYLVFNNTFYVVADTIAQGGIIVPDTNVVKTTVEEEFKKITETAYLIVSPTYSLNIRKYGKICTLSSNNGYFKTQNTDWNELAIIPAGYRPYNTLYYSNYNSSGNFALSSEGKWLFQGKAANTTYSTISTITYITP